MGLTIWRGHSKAIFVGGYLVSMAEQELSSGRKEGVVLGCRMTVRVMHWQ